MIKTNSFRLRRGALAGRSVFAVFMAAAFIVSGFFAPAAQAIITTLTITSPNGGEQWSGVHNITWTYTGGAPGDLVNIVYSADNFDSQAVIATNVPYDYNAGSYFWNTASLPDGENYKIRFIDSSLFVYDTSDSNFRIDNTPPVVDAGSDKITKDLFTQDAIASDPAPSSGIASYLWTKQSGPGTITFGTPNAEDTTISADADGTYVIRLTVTDNAGNSTYDELQLIWDTTPPSVPTVLNPNGGNYLKGGSSYDITWTPVTDVNLGATPIKIEYAADGSTFVTVADNEANDGSYSWTVPSSDLATAKIKITATDLIDNSSNDVSDTAFTIDSTNPAITASTLLTPSASDIYLKGGSDYAITWNAGEITDTNLSTNPIKIEYAVNGLTFVTVADNEANDGSYTWHVPSDNTSAAKIRITATDQAGNFSNDVSDNPFIVDSINPVVSVSAPITVTRTNPATLTVSVTDASPVTCTYQIDGGVPAAIACTGGSIAVTDGKHIFLVTAVDSATNSGSGSRTAVIDLNHNLTVGSGKDFTTIQEAVDNALTGDTITIDTGSYSEAVTINGKNLTLTGSGGAVTANSFTLTSTSVSGSTNVTAPTVNVNSGAKIQDGVLLASSGGTVTVAAGIYDEQVVIDKSLTLQGAGDTTIVRPSSAAKLTQVFTGLFWYGGTKNIAGIIVANVSAGSSVTVKNLKIDESSVTTKPAGADYLTGIFYRETGGTVDTVSIVGGGAWSSGDRAYGMYLSAAANTVTVEVKSSNISNFDKEGINAEGNTLTVNIHHNTIIGRGSITDEVQNGIDIGRDAVGTVNYNTISNLIYTSEQWWAAGIMFYSYVSPTGKSATANNNTITDCQIGIIFKNTNATAQNNTVNGGTVGLSGIYAEPNASGAWTASFVGNTVSGVKDDSFYHDENAAIGANTYSSVSPGATLTVTIDNNILTSGSATADGISIGVGGATGSIIATITNNTISNWQYGIRLAGALVNANSSSVTSNKITGNGTYGAYNGGTGTLDARINWWGHWTGPYHSTNPLGAGNAVTDYVTFSKWCTNDTCTTFGSNSPLAQLAITTSPGDSVAIPNPITLTITGKDSEGIIRVNDSITQAALMADRGAAFGSNLVALANGIGSTNITNTVTGLVNILASQVGGSVTGTKQVTFTASDAVAPTISSHTPADNAPGVSVLIAPYIDFSEPLKATTVNSTNIQLKKYSDDSAVSATISLVEGGTRVVITLSSQLAYNTQYYFAVSTAVQDQTGNALTSALDVSTKASHEFTTVAIQPIVVDEVVAQNNYVTADNTYINGWHYIFRITVNTNETNMKVKFDDWVNSGDPTKTVVVNGNTRLLFNTAGGGVGAGVGLTNSDIENGYGTVRSYALGNNYTDQTYLGVPSAVDISGVDNSTAAGRQIQFDVFTKIPVSTTPGFYTTNYGIQVN